MRSYARSFPRGRALLLALIAAPGWAQEPGSEARLDALLDELDPPAVESLLERLGPAPALAELLLPLEPGFTPIMQRTLEAEATRLSIELAIERDRLVDEDLLGALAMEEERAALLAEGLGADHPRTCEALWNARRLGVQYELDAEDARLLIQVRGNEDAMAQLFHEGRHAEALGKLVELIVTERELLGSDVAMAPSIGSLSPILHGLGDYARAERAARAGLAATMVEFGPRHPFVARALKNLALLTSAPATLEEARALHEHSLALHRELYGDSSLEFATALVGVVDYFRLSNELERAGETVERGIVISRERGSRPDLLAIQLMQRGVVEWMSGEDLLARESLEEAIRVFERVHPGDNAEYANGLGALADLERGLGNHRRALALAEQSLAMLEHLHSGPHPLKGIAHHRHAMSLEILGELDHAERAYRFAIYALAANRTGNIASAMDGLASLLARKGDVHGAEELRARALSELRSAFGRSRMVARALRAHARELNAAGRQGAAVEALREAEGMYRDLVGAEHFRVAQIEVELARLLAVRGELKAAQKIASRVLESASDPQALAGANLLAGQLAAMRGDFSGAQAFAQRAWELRHATLEAPHPELVEALAFRGEISEARGELDAAGDSYMAALDQADSLRTRILGDERDRAVYAGELSLASLARSLSRVELALGNPRAALEAAERGRERALLDLLKRSESDLFADAIESGAVDDDELSRRIAREAAARRSLMIAEQELRRAVAAAVWEAGSIRALEARVAGSRRELYALESELEASLRDVWPSALPLSAEAVEQNLNADEALLHYTFDERGVGLVVVRGGSRPRWLGITLAGDTKSSGELRIALFRLIEMARLASELHPELRRAISEQLLPESAWERLTGCRRVVIVPDGLLHELPFELLLTPSGSWLEHGPRIILSPSAALFASQRGGRGPRTARPTRAVVLGAPNFDHSYRVQPAEFSSRAGAMRSSLDRVRLFGAALAPLPGSAVEARRVADALTAAGWEVTTLLDEHACAPRLLERAHGAGLLHLATHAFSADASRPYEAALALAAPESWSAVDDGFLTLDDLVRRWGGVLKNCELVVLSACETQRGVPLGDSRVALPWGFFFAGARKVIVTLWKVDDRANALLMDRFYSSYTGQFDSARKVANERFEPGRALSAEAALQEAKSWIARSTPAENRARLEAMGYDTEAGSAKRGDFPLPGAEPRIRPIADAFDFRAPRFGSAVVLYGLSD